LCPDTPLPTPLPRCSQLLGQALLADDVDTAFDRCYQAHGEGGSSLAAWLGTGGGGAGQVAAVRAALAAGAALVQLLTLCGSTLDASVLRYQLSASTTTATSLSC